MSKPQHTTPCATCPFNCKVDPGALGGSSPLVYIGQANGPFFLPCHSTRNYRDEADRRNTDNPQCAGAAIFRANVGVADSMPTPLLHLPVDNNKVFGTFAEFLAHHKQITMQAAESFLRDFPPEKLMKMAARSPSATFTAVPKAK